MSIFEKFVFKTFWENFVAMKKSIIVFKIIFSFLAAFTNNVKGQSPISLISSSNNSLVIKYELPGFEFVEVETSKGLSVIPIMKGASPILIEGAPDLPKYACSYIVPDGSVSSIKILKSSYIDYDYDIAPSKGNLTRNINLSKVPYFYGKQYNKDAFFPSVIYDAQSPYIVRDFNGQAIWIYPMQYNPVKNVLRVYEFMELEIQFQSSIIYPTSMDSQFEMIYEDLFINYDTYQKSNIDIEDGSMLIIADYQFVDQMADFMVWKSQKGIYNEIVDIASIGNNQEALKTFIEEYYHSHNLTYVLFVGDHQHIPAYISASLSGYSDNYYGYIDGDDSYPEVFVGRFSAENQNQVMTQVNRVIQYEQNPVISEAYSNSVGVGSSEGPGDDGEYDYQHLRNIRSDLLNYTYTFGYELYDGSQGGEDAEGNPNASDLHVLLQEGMGLINYTGHGSSLSCSSSGYNSSNVNQLTNTDVHPFFWSVACVNGDFTGSTCFAETWLRAKHNETGEPTGAIATLMSTINQSWAPPMEGQDHMNLILTEMSENSQSRSFGGISMNGCMKMNYTYGSSGDEMTDTWTCFGDPSVMVRTKAPENIEVSYSSNVYIESNSIDVLCSVDDAIVVLTQDGEIIGSGIVSEGYANVSFNDLSSLNSITITVTASNSVPHIGYISVSSPELITQQVINLPESWSLFSTYMLTDDMDIASVLNNLDTEIILVKDVEGMAYLPNWNFNGIGEMIVGQGYQIKIQDAVNFTIQGVYMLPEENPIYLIDGWNLVAYLRLENAPVEAVFESLNVSGNLIVVKDEQGLAYIPNWNFNGIGNLYPGKAYQIKTNNDDFLHYLPNSESY